MNNPEKLATKGTQDEEKQNKNTTQYVLDTIMRKQTQIMYIRRELNGGSLNTKLMKGSEKQFHKNHVRMQTQNSYRMLLLKRCREFKGVVTVQGYVTLRCRKVSKRMFNILVGTKTNVLKRKWWSRDGLMVGNQVVLPNFFLRQTMLKLVIKLIHLYFVTYYITNVCLIFDSNSLMTYLFWSHEDH